jgi:DNA (cytosine-5)-methyltransferase 1
MTSRRKRSGTRVALSLFAGAGGLDLGVEEAGFTVLGAIENDPTAVATLNLNRGQYFPRLGHVEPTDITTADPCVIARDLGVGAGEIDLLVGGPPCVAFSKSGFHLEYKRQGQDSKAALLDDYLRFLKWFRPKAFLMENVYGLAYQNQSAAWFNRLRAGIASLGYGMSWEILNAADYGVPQNRQRLFLVGAQGGHALGHPVPTHWGQHERRVRPTQASRLKPHVTAGMALRGLRSEPEAEEVVGGKYGHLLADIPPGKNYLFYTAHEGHPEPLFNWRSRYWTFLLKLDPDRPASTIQGQPGPYVGPFHWDNRRLRIPELKRLQGFPDLYAFAGNRRSIQLQVGNSVPPPLARTVADHIRKQLDGEFAVGSIAMQMVIPELSAPELIGVAQ